MLLPYQNKIKKSKIKIEEHSARPPFWQKWNSKWLLVLVLEFLSLLWMASIFIPAWRNQTIIIVI